MQELEWKKTYKTEESESTQHQELKYRLKKEYTRRLRMILKSELKAKHKITATEGSSIPVLR
jgi:hypothetical protein